jgi:hypothetical protein
MLSSLAPATSWLLLGTLCKENLVGIVVSSWPESMKKLTIHGSRAIDRSRLSAVVTKFARFGSAVKGVVEMTGLQM